LLQAPEIQVIAGLLPGQESVEGVVKIIIPEGVQAIPPQFGRTHQAHAVEVAFRH